MKKSDKYAQLHFFAFLFALPFAFFFALFLLYKTILAPCIYGWRARHNASLHASQRLIRLIAAKRQIVLTAN